MVPARERLASATGSAGRQSFPDDAAHDDDVAMVEIADKDATFRCAPLSKGTAAPTRSGTRSVRR